MKASTREYIAARISELWPEMREMLELRFSLSTSELTDEIQNVRLVWERVRTHFVVVHREHGLPPLSPGELANAQKTMDLIAVQHWYHGSVWGAGYFAAGPALLDIWRATLEPLRLADDQVALPAMQLRDALIDVERRLDILKKHEHPFDNGIPDGQSLDPVSDVETRLVELDALEYIVERATAAVVAGDRLVATLSASPE